MEYGYGYGSGYDRKYKKKSLAEQILAAVSSSTGDRIVLPERALNDALDILYRRNSSCRYISLHMERDLEECKSNVNCFAYLEQQKSWSAKLFAYTEAGPSDNDVVRQKLGPDPRASFRPKEVKYCGLVNLGSTCYLNALIQCLFSNEELRSIVFSWKRAAPAAGAEKKPEETSRDEILVQLQMLMAALQTEETSRALDRRHSPRRWRFQRVCSRTPLSSPSSCCS